MEIKPSWILLFLKTGCKKILLGWRETTKRRAEAQERGDVLPLEALQLQSCT